MWRWLMRILGPEQSYLPEEKKEPKPPSLEWLTATVFVRESNGSKTNLEHHLEQELISRGARVLLANQHAGMAMVKQGEFLPLHVEAHFTVVGSLVVRSGINRNEKEFTEKDHDFNERLAEFMVEYRRWKQFSQNYLPEPQFEGRSFHWVMVAVIQYHLSFRLIGRDGAILASGTCEDFPHADNASNEDTLRVLAKNAIAYLDKTDVWSKIVIV